MEAICVDGESTVVRMAVSVWQERFGGMNAHGFTEAEAALAWAEEHDVDMAVVGTDLPGAPGLRLAEKIREACPDAEIIILSGDGRHAVEAFEIRACGYLVKPVARDRLAAELDYALEAWRNHPARPSSPVVIRTFGNFELFVDSRKVQFERSRAKELLALLVDQEGDRMRRNEIYAELWDGAEYDRKAQKMLDVIIRSLKKTLTDYHIDYIMEAKDGALCVLPDRVDCDMYRFLAGDRRVAEGFHGVYMGSYPWARTTEGYLTQLMEPDQGRLR